MMDPDEDDDLETISQLLSERNGAPKKNGNNRPVMRNSPRSGANLAGSNGSNVSDLRRKIEKQLDSTSKQPKPSPGAVPIGFRDNVGNTVRPNSILNS
jgi:hypothetical protein